MNDSTNSKFLYIIDKSKPFRGACIDILVNGKASVSGKTLEEKNEEYGGNLVAVTEYQFLNDYLEPYHNSLQGEFKEIDEERYNDMLEVLPPLRWNNGMFWLMEAQTGSLHDVYIQHQGKYYTALRDMKKSNQEIKTEFLEWLSKK